MTTSATPKIQGTRKLPPPVSGVRARLGFNLIEVLIAMVVAGLLMAIALPGSAKLHRSMRMDSGTQVFMRELMRAQTEAIKRNQSRSVTKVNDSTFQVEGRAESVLPDGVRFAATSADSVRFAAFGPPPGGGAVFRLEYGDLSRIVDVNPSGLVSLK